MSPVPPCALTPPPDRPPLALAAPPASPFPQEPTPVSPEQLALGRACIHTVLERKVLAYARRDGIPLVTARAAWEAALDKESDRIAAGRAVGLAHLPAWLMQVWKHKAIDHGRARRRRPTVHPDRIDRQTRYRRNRPDQVHLAMTAAIPEALSKLSNADRKLLRFCYVGDKTYDAAADRFATTVVAIHGKLYRARQRLRRAVIAVLLREGFDRAELPA